MKKFGNVGNNDIEFIDLKQDSDISDMFERITTEISAVFCKRTVTDGLRIPNTQRPRIKDKSEWEPDESSNSCSRCRKEYTFISRRRHHCRFCGRLFCYDPTYPHM
jgi:hypothetical protein